MDVDSIGVSKLCCPICWDLLNYLAGRDNHFAVRGRHSTLYEVELPDGLSLDALKKMVKIYEDKLRSELIGLARGTGMETARTPSGQSNTNSASSYSTFSDNDDSDPDIEAPNVHEHDGDSIGNS
jgi:hypothetical protein